MANKDTSKGNPAGDSQSNQTSDPTSSNPDAISAPDRTGVQTSTGSTTSEREAKIDLKPLDTPSPSSRAEAEVNEAVEEAMHQEYVQNEARRRVNAERAKRMMDSVNTENPYDLKEGEKPVYQVGNFLCDPDGTRIQKVSNEPLPQRDVIVDRATSMKQM